MIEYILISIGLILAILGLIGCIIPALPGPPLNYLSLIMLALAIKDAFQLEFYLWWGGITIVVVILDYILPILGAKAYKASRSGIWGSVFGMLIGIFFFPPFGMIIGLFIGTVIGEIIAGKKEWEAIKVGTVTFLTSILMIFIKLGVSGIMTYYFIKRSVEYIF